MKLNSRNLSRLLLLLIIGILLGSLGWEVLERIIRLGGLEFSLTTQNPITLFDLYVLSLSFRANPGTLLGALGAILVFKRI